MRRAPSWAKKRPDPEPGGIPAPGAATFQVPLHRLNCDPDTTPRVAAVDVQRSPTRVIVRTNTRRYVLDAEEETMKDGPVEGNTLVRRGSGDIPEWVWIALRYVDMEDRFRCG